MRWLKIARRAILRFERTGWNGTSLDEGEWRTFEQVLLPVLPVRGIAPESLHCQKEAAFSKYGMSTRLT
jgi:hypothetical protein